MRKIFSLILALGFGFLASAQDTNRVDDNGLKQGVWKKYFSNGTPRYIGQFKDDKPYGEFIYYSPYEFVLAKTRFVNPEVSYTTMFHKNGEQRAFGKNVKEKKDSTWTYYNEEGELISTVDYQKGEKHGWEVTYFTPEQAAEKIPWQQGVKEGTWEQYFGTGQMKGTGTFKAGKWSGAVTFYHLNGKVHAKGEYREGYKTGLWEYYDEEGNLESKEWYEKGRMVKKEGGEDSEIKTWLE